MNENKMKNFNLSDIITARINFINDNDIFDKNEYYYINMGEMKAYEEMLKDLEILCVSDFICKYRNFLIRINQDFEDNTIKDNNEREMLSGYNNAIVFVLSLINPIYEYEV